MHILTEKGVAAHLKDGEITLIDPLGNTAVSTIDKNISTTLNSRYGLSPIILVDESFIQENGINPSFDNTSLILKTDDNCLTYLQWSDNLLSIIRQIEWTCSQIIYGKTFDSDDVANWLVFNQQDAYIRDCHCDSKAYEKFIAAWSKELPDLTKSFQTHYELTRLIEIVRFEMSHAETRIREAINWISSVIKIVHQEHGLEKGSELVKYGVPVDQIGWCITDSVKSLSTALDTLSKFIAVISVVSPNKVPKTPAVLAGNIAQFRPKGELVPGNRYDKIQECFSKVKSLINLRHELTHNQALYPVRQPAFVGYATPCVKGEEIAYGEIMWWDVEEEHFSRSCGRIGFFAQKKNAIIEVTTAFKNTCALIDILLDTAKLQVLGSARKLNFKEICVLDFDKQDKHTFAKHSITDLHDTQ